MSVNARRILLAVGWRPAEALIYGWVPFYRNRRLFERLAGIRVFVRVSAPTAMGSHTGTPTASPVA